MEKPPKRIITIELEEDDEVINRDVKKFGGKAGHIILPVKHIGKNALIILAGKEGDEFVEENKKHDKKK